MIYVVTGDGPRCGSSMMLECLKQGGMEIVDDERCNWEDLKIGGTRLCPEGESLHELSTEEVMVPEFPVLEKYDGKVFKLWVPPWGPLTHIASGGGREYSVLWLHRPSEHRWKSFSKQHEGTDIFMNPLEAAIRDMAASNAFKTLVWRNDMKVIELQFLDVVHKPIEMLSNLRAMGWPINVERAAKVPDKDKVDFR